MSLSDTGRIVLTRAAAHDDRLASFHKKLPAGARNKVIDSLRNQGLLEETRGTYRSAPTTEQGDGMLLTTLRITDAGFRAIDLDPPTTTEADTELDLRQEEQVDAENAADVAATVPQTASAVTVAMD